MGNCLAIAHRGASSLAPENTIAAFKKAYEVGADGIELDVQLSKDGVPVVIHDEMVNRTTGGEGWVKDMTATELKNLDAGSWFSGEFAGETIPTLGEVLEEFKNRCFLINIELKMDVVKYQGLEEAVIDEIKSRHLEEKIIISSFNHDSLKICKKINPAIRTGFLYTSGNHNPWEYIKKLGCYSAHPFFLNLFYPGTVQGFKKNGIPVFAWTVNIKFAMKHMIRAGVEAVITDKPDQFTEMRKKHLIGQCTNR